MPADQKLSASSLIRLEGELSKRFESVQGQLKKLQGTIDSLEGAWQGIGANAFNKKQDAINLRMGNIARRLTEFQNSIKAARTISDGNEEDIRAALASVDAGDGGGTQAKTSAFNNL
ncbi:WXG100 family type VII secretion target [Streptomyces sp. NBC_01754]|uniref:WXG100 family type VII secretion target n=1 Tax=Streptomyces sp. NBC_01754 TaxID=2975930 RepID=UPI002DD86CCC|nr:WXG100 family type VII secretion target [Streptomyces sp. NBC_01754]WSC95181.1 WXG100 family type VII secretion target [Streptomyces sp. NBC_01754]